ncbi:MAG: hypothetical protein C3F02_03515 [Parcubacteria group bacterium]|nr:MAG: hypothetical protein C3F02_03515 [Parcubacteria group bacterium]
MEKILNKLIWGVLTLILLVPIYVNSNFLFPYIFSKTIVFRILVEILLLLWLLYLWAKRESKIKIDWLTIVFALYLLTAFVSAIWGVNFYFSFWSNTERGEGLLLWLHLFIWFFVLRNFISEKKHWLGLFDIFFLGAQVIGVLGLLQYAGVDFINQTGVGADRVASTIGNAAYLAGYLLFAVFIGLYLSVYRKKLYLRLYYWLFVALDLFIAFQTGTRGAFIAFIATVLLFFIYNIFKISGSKLRRFLIAGALVFIILLALTFTNRNSSLVQKNTILRRITGISWTERTAQTRFMAWNSAWQGFKDKPILGYGQDNFQYVFNKYFNPQIYAHAGSQIWYDRAHNIFLDHLIAGGLIGLILYGVLIFGPLWVLFKKGLRSKSDGLTLADKIQLGDQMLFLAIIAFIVQGMVVFEALVTYLPLVLIIAVVGAKFIPFKFNLARRPVIYGLAIFYLIAFGFILYYVNIREIQSNRTLIKAVRSQNADVTKAIDTYFEAMKMNTSGRQEYRRIGGEFIDGLIVNKKIGPYDALRYAQKLDGELDMRVKDFPSDVANYLLYMRHLNYTYILDPTRLDKVETLGQEAIKYSPTRQQFYQEMGYADVYLYQMYRDQGKTVEAKKYQQGVLTNFDQALELNPFVTESYVNIIMTLIATDQSDLVQNYLDQVTNFDSAHTYDRRLNTAPAFSEDNYLRLANSAISAKDFKWALYFSLILKEKYPDNPQYYINVALSYANIDKKSEAIAVAEEIKKFGGEYELQADDFIKKIKNSTFEKVK